jgi:TolB-like protein
VASWVVAAIILALVAAYLVHWLAIRQVAVAARASLPQKSIAVLPFLDLTTQEMNEGYFAD